MNLAIFAANDACDLWPSAGALPADEAQNRSHGGGRSPDGRAARTARGATPAAEKTAPPPPPLLPLPALVPLQEGRGRRTQCSQRAGAVSCVAREGAKSAGGRGKGAHRPRRGAGELPTRRRHRQNADSAN